MENGGADTRAVASACVSLVSRTARQRDFDGPIPRHDAVVGAVCNYFYLPSGASAPCKTYTCVRAVTQHRQLRVWSTAKGQEPVGVVGEMRPKSTSRCGACFTRRGSTPRVPQRRHLADPELPFLSFTAEARDRLLVSCQALEFPNFCFWLPWPCLDVAKTTCSRAAGKT